ncbi:MAG TPA: RIP metalloprotease RseP [Thermodesulfobacteriota bacterium]|nr:RIP metalloprotease RseP [Thermodesulfobacteriota bacterium]
MLITIVSTVIVLGILIFVHELGHFLLSKKMGVKVLKFSLGFGPKLIGKKVGETEYQIAVFPLGGFVKPLGEDPNEDIKDEEYPRSFWAQAVWKRALIIGAGPFFNFFLAASLFSCVNLIAGIPSLPSVPPQVEEVSPGFPAEAAGLKKGDLILSINGKDISAWEELQQVVTNSQGKELSLKVKRNDETVDINVTPKPFTEKNLFGEETRTFKIGVTHAPVNVVYQRVGPFVALGNGFAQTWQVIELTLTGIVKLIQRVIPAKEIGSPIMIAKLAGEQARRGLLSLAVFTAIISINLGVINLFPIPILDGGHLFFLVLEAILRKPVSLRKMEIAQQIGLIFIILLMLFAIRNDVVRYFLPGGFKF